MREARDSIPERVRALRGFAARRKEKAEEIGREITRLETRRTETLVEAESCLRAADELEAAGRQAAE